MRRIDILLFTGAAAVAITTTAIAAQSESRPVPRYVLVGDSELMMDRASTGGISWVDFDGDGDDDVFVTNGYDVSRSPAVPQANRLYENVDGKLVALRNPISEDAGFSSGSACADLDNDGLIDCFVPNQRGQDNFLYLNRGGGVFERLVAAAPSRGGGLSFSATWGDIDADGLVDLFVSNGGLAGVGRNFLYRNLGGRELEPIRSGAVVTDELQSGGATFVDYDLDGDVDLFVPGQKARMFRNEGPGNLVPDAGPLFVNEPWPSGLSVSGAWGDFDNDGDFDLFQAVNDGSPRRMYVNEGGGRFVRRDVGDATRDRSEAFHSMWADLDNDGLLDLLVANWGAPPQIYMNHNGDSLERAAAGEMEERAWYASMVATSDYDLDGDLDLAVGNWPNEPGAGEANLLYRNDGPTGHWIALRLQGTSSNRSAIGARVVVTVGAPEGHTVLREVRSQDGWRSQSSLEVLVGLGRAEVASSVTVFWPSGTVQEVGRIEAGERRLIREPRGATGDLDRQIEAVLDEQRVPGAAAPGDVSGGARVPPSTGTLNNGAPGRR